MQLIGTFFVLILTAIPTNGKIKLFEFQFRAVNWLTPFVRSFVCSLQLFRFFFSLFVLQTFLGPIHFKLYVTPVECHSISLKKKFVIVEKWNWESKKKKLHYFEIFAILCPREWIGKNVKLNFRPKIFSVYSNYVWIKLYDALISSSIELKWSRRNEHLGRRRVSPSQTNRVFKHGV